MGNTFKPSTRDGFKLGFGFTLGSCVASAVILLVLVLSVVVILTVLGIGLAGLDDLLRAIGVGL